MSRPTCAQLEALVDFLENNPGIYKGIMRTHQEKLETKRKWENVAQSLNSIGGAVNDGKGWSKYWADKKCALKKLCGQYAQSMRQTGVGVGQGIPLTAVEQRMVALIGGQQIGLGDQQLAVNPFPPSQEDTTPPSMVLNLAEDVVLEEIEIHQSPPAASRVLTQQEGITTTPRRSPRLEARTQHTSIPRPRARNRRTNQLHWEADRLAGIEERRVQAEQVTAQAFADAVAHLNGYIRAIENHTEVTQQIGQLLANSINESAHLLASSLSEIANSLRR